MKKVLSIALFLAASTAWLPAQELKVDSLVRRFQQYREQALSEKIYAHLDRNLYLTGETVWFKVYNVDGTLHKPMNLSRVAYAEILDGAGTPVLQAKIELENSIGHGSFFLPASLNTGNYKFRIYTNWMKNFPPQFYYTQVIGIINTLVIPDQPQTRVAPSCKVDFFPEGGLLVSGVESKVGFKVYDQSGKGAPCRGVIQNENGDVIASFTPKKFGLGHFMIKPESDVKYKAVIIDASGNSSTHPFPVVQSSGYTLRLDDADGRLTVTVHSKGTRDSYLYLFTHARQIIANAQAQPLRNGEAVFHLNKNDLPEGVAQITLFNEALQPVCERLYFTWPRKELRIAVSTNQRTYSPRRKVTVSIESMFNAGSPVPSKLSMAAFRVDSLSSETAGGIFPYLWLTSDLGGGIETPEYYFNMENPEVPSDMENLMLTHGWRRFDWQDVLQRKTRYAFLPEVREHIVTATIMRNGKKGRGTLTYLGSPGRIIRAYGVWSNANGESRFEIKDFYGPRRIIVQAVTDSSEQVDIKIVDPFSPQKDDAKIAPLIIRDEMKAELELRSVAMQVQDIYYYDEYATRTETPPVDSSAFYGKADATYLLDDYTRFPLMEEVMREYVPGVFVRKRKDGFHFVVTDQVNGGVMGGDPMVLMDGVPVPDVDDLMAVDPLRVKKLEVVKRPYYLGQASFPGIVSYTTYQGDLGGLRLDPRSVSLDYDGLQMKRIFHKPQYAREQTNDRMPDQRVLLHWEPDILTGPDGKAQIEFYTSDVEGTYLIVVQGITESGLSGTATRLLTVKPNETP